MYILVPTQQMTSFSYITVFPTYYILRVLHTHIVTYPFVFMYKTITFIYFANNSFDFINPFTH